MSVQVEDDWFEPDVRPLRHHGWMGKVTVEAAPGTYLQISAEGGDPDTVVALLERATIQELGPFRERANWGRRSYDISIHKQALQGYDTENHGRRMRMYSV